MKSTRSIFISFCIAIFCLAGITSCELQETPKTKTATQINDAKHTASLNIYNMGGVPRSEIEKLTKRMSAVYPDVKYCGEISLVDSAKIVKEKKGNNRYWFSKLLPHVRKTIHNKNNITLVVVNAEVCNWTENGSHANLGISPLGGRISFVSYQRLKVNKLNNEENMFKVAIHELGHSVARLVAERKDLRCHCPNEACLMKDANNHFPYINVSSFCKECSEKMKSHNFDVRSLNL